MARKNRTSEVKRSFQLWFQSICWKTRGNHPSSNPLMIWPKTKRRVLNQFPRLPCQGRVEAFSSPGSRCSQFIQHMDASFAHLTCNDSTRTEWRSFCGVDFCIAWTHITPFEKQLTRHSKWPPQSSGVLLALFELHAAHSDDLTHQEEAWPHQVTAAQVLDAKGQPQRLFFRAYLAIRCITYKSYWTTCIP